MIMVKQEKSHCLIRASCKLAQPDYWGLGHWFVLVCYSWRSRPDVPYYQRKVTPTALYIEPTLQWQFSYLDIFPV